MRAQIFARGRHARLPLRPPAASGGEGEPDAAQISKNPVSRPRGPGRGSRVRTAFLFFLAALASIQWSGCGYSFEPIVRKSARKIHVPVIVNDTRRHGLEALLTRALSEELRQAGMRPARREDCDAILECSITSAPGETLAEDPAGVVPEKRLSIEVRYRLVDRQGALIADGSAAGAGETLSSGPDRAGSGVERAVAECARALVRALEPRPGDN